MFLNQKGIFIRQSPSNENLARVKMMMGEEELFGSLYEKGCVIFNEGDPSDRMYIIQSGALKVTQQRGKHEELLTFLEKGDLVGEIALLDGNSRTATVKAITQSRLLAFTRESLLTHISKDPGVCHHILKALTSKILRADRRLQEKLVNVTDLQIPSLTAQVEPSISVSLLEDLWATEEAPLHLDPGEIIFHEGDVGDYLYIVKEGLVEIIRSNGKAEQLMACIGKGSFLGEMALITGERRTATCKARQPTELLPIEKENFQHRLRDFPELGLYLIISMIKRLRQREALLDNPNGTIEIASSQEVPQLSKQFRWSISLVSLSTCGGCAAALLADANTMNDFLHLGDIVYCPMLMDERDREKIDIAIVDGVVRVKEDVQKLLDTRARARYLIALGTCSVLGGVPALANQFELEDLLETSYGQTHNPLSYYLSGKSGIDQSIYQDRGLSLLRRSGRLDDFVRVDYYLPGCPPNPVLLVELLKEIGGQKSSLKTPKIICAECSKKPTKTHPKSFQLFPDSPPPEDTCLASAGIPCMGFLTRGGCEAACPRAGLPCWGCRGPSASAFRKMEQGERFDELFCRGLSTRSGLQKDDIFPIIKLLRRLGQIPYQFDRRFSRLR